MPVSMRMRVPRVSVLAHTTDEGAGFLRLLIGKPAPGGGALTSSFGRRDDAHCPLKTRQVVPVEDTSNRAPGRCRECGSDFGSSGVEELEGSMGDAGRYRPHRAIYE